MLRKFLRGGNNAEEAKTDHTTSNQQNSHQQAVQSSQQQAQPVVQQPVYAAIPTVVPSGKILEVSGPTNNVPNVMSPNQHAAAVPIAPPNSTSKVAIGKILSVENPVVNINATTIHGKPSDWPAGSPKKKALLIGINYTRLGKSVLRGCINDVKNIQNFINQKPLAEVVF